MRRLAAAALLATASGVARGQPAPLDTVAPPALRALGRDILAELVAVNTVQPEGDVTAASERVARRFRAAGFSAADVQVVGAGARTRNLVVRWRAPHADGRRPILLFAHLDVVAARRDDWSMDPFTLTEQGGWYYGRGTLDTKGGAAQLAAALLHLKASGWSPGRDVILALTAGEESGIDNGVQWLLANRRDVTDVAWAWNPDGGGGEARGGKRVALDVELAEKVYQSFTLTVRNAGGHSSVPVADNAIYRLAAALSRVAAFTFPTHLTDVTRAWLGAMARLDPGPTGAAMARLAADPSDAGAAAALSGESAFLNAELRTTCVATLLEGGHAENALPQRATATVNCRLVPGESPDSVRRRLERVVADTAVAVAPVAAATPSPPTPIDTAVFGAVARAVRAAWEPVPVVPFMDTGASDGLYLRNAGVPTYVFWPLFFDADDMRAHGRDERISVEEFARGLGFTVRFLRDVAGATSPPFTP